MSSTFGLIVDGVVQGGTGSGTGPAGPPGPAGPAGAAGGMGAYTYIFWNDTGTYRYYRGDTGAEVANDANFADLLNDCYTAAAAGDTIYIRPGTYVVDDAIIGKSGVSLLGGGRGTLFDCSTLAHDAIALTYTGSIAAGVALSANATKNDDHIHVVSTTFTAEDLILVNANAVWRANPQSGYQGEFQWVGSTAAGLINLRITTNNVAWLMDSYTTANSAQVQEVTPTRDFTIEGISFLGLQGDTAAVGECLVGIKIKYGYNFTIRGCFFQSMTYAAVECQQSLEFRVTGNYMYLCNMSGNGYGVALDWGDQNALVNDNIMEYCRHGVAVGGGGSANPGIPRNIHVDNNSVSNSYIANLDCHQLGENINFTNNRCLGGNRGIRFAAYSGSIVGNSFIGLPNDYGVEINPGVAVDGAVISGNIFNGLYHGVYIVSGNNYCITGNSMINIIGDAVHIQAGVTDVNIVGNQLNGGVDDAGTGTLIRSNIGQADN